MRSFVLSLFASVAAQDLFLAQDSEEVRNVKHTLGEFEAMMKREMPAGSPLPNVPCMMRHCMKELISCAGHSLFGDKCMATTACILKGTPFPNDKYNRAPQAAYLCEMISGYESESFGEYIKCAGEDHKCLPTYPQDGECLAQDEDAVQNLTKLEQLEGDWWVIKGVNCGQVADGTPFHPEMLPKREPTKGKNFPGGYDWYPCQHERIVRSTGHDYPEPSSPWVNNITYCGGSNGGLAECSTPIIDTVANITMCAPGVVCHEYIDAPLKPQFEHWRIISWPHPDWTASVWCGSTPLVPYNGGIALRRNKRDMTDMPEWVEQNFREAYAKHGIDWDQMCESSNKDCP
jgi:hypothetical protein